MRILITGDRYWFRPALAAEVVKRLVARYGQDIVIVHGGATGVDSAFALAAKGLGVTTEAHPVSEEDWRAKGKGAGPQRNRSMVDLGADLCLAFHQSISTSRGTKDCVRQAIRARIPCYLIDSEELIPRRLFADDPRLA